MYSEIYERIKVIEYTTLFPRTIGYLNKTLHKNKGVLRYHKISQTCVLQFQNSREKSFNAQMKNLKRGIYDYEEVLIAVMQPAHLTTHLVMHFWCLLREHSMMREYSLGR